MTWASVFLQGTLTQDGQVATIFQKENEDPRALESIRVIILPVQESNSVSNS